MKDIMTRLQHARRAAGFETASEAARFFGWNENTYRSHENGERGLKQKIAHRYAQAFKASPSWLLLGEGHENIDYNVYATGWISDNGYVMVDTRPQGSKLIIQLPFRVPAQASCFLFSNHTRYPRYDKNDLILLWGEISLDTVEMTMEGIARLGDDRLLFGIFHISDKGEATMESIGQPPVRDLRIVKFYPVQAVVRHGRYRPREANGLPFQGPA